MICHLVFEHEFSQGYYDFIVKHFSLEDHKFIIYGRSSISKSAKFNFHNSIYTDNIGVQLEILHAATSIVVHGLFFNSLVDFLYNNNSLLNKVNWKLWGGDLYLYRHVGTELMSQEQEEKRKTIIRNLRWITCPFLEDFTLACSEYKTTAEYLCGFYSFTIDYETLDRVRKSYRPPGPIKILLGNSATESNMHEEALHMLSRFKEADIHVYCPLSYGNQNYTDQVIKLGAELLGDKFCPITTVMPYEEYAAFLSSIDIAVMNHNRQQALGNIGALLYLGKKIYLRTEINTYAAFSKIGIKLYDIYDLVSSSLDGIVSFGHEVASSNINAIRREYSHSKCREVWSNIFSVMERDGHVEGESLVRKMADKIRNTYFAGSSFIGPYEAAGHIAPVCEEQWLWHNRNLIKGVVLDMSTPRYWHEYIYQLKDVEKVIISDYDQSEVSKSDKTSKVDVIGDFCASPAPLPDESIDTVICLSILEHCEDMFAMFRNLSNILKPGGHAFFLTPYAYIDGHLSPDYWRIGRDGYRLLAKNTDLEIIQEISFGDMGKYLINDFGINAAANEWHRGIPNAIAVICRKRNRKFDSIKEGTIVGLPNEQLSNVPKVPTTDLSWETIRSCAQARLYAGDVPQTPEYEGWIGLSLTQQNDRHIQHDITLPFPLPDNSIDCFQAEDVFEHIPYDRLVPVVNEIHRILKPGGLFRLSTPDYGCDVLRNRSIQDEFGNIVFDPGGGGTAENPGHVWFPRVESVYRLLEKTNFHTKGSMEFLHYWNMDNFTHVTRPIDYSKGIVRRTPDFDDRVKIPFRPMSIVVDLFKDKGQLPSQSDHYNSDYFDWQKNIGAFGGVVNLFKFREFIKPSDTIIDFGCGGGFLLNNINCLRKLGIEVNPTARQQASTTGISVYASACEIADNCADIIISNHALQHVFLPLEELKQLYRKLRIGGLAVFVVPHQDTREAFDPKDINQHLYTWNQLTLGNLFKTAGFLVQRVEAIQHQWPVNYIDVYDKLGEQEFHRICHKNAVKNNNYQIRIIAVK